MIALTVFLLLGAAEAADVPGCSDGYCPTGTSDNKDNHDQVPDEDDDYVPLLAVKREVLKHSGDCLDTGVPHSEARKYGMEGMSCIDFKVSGMCDMNIKQGAKDALAKYCPVSCKKGCGASLAPPTSTAPPPAPTPAPAPDCSDSGVPHSEARKYGMEGMSCIDFKVSGMCDMNIKQGAKDALAKYCPVSCKKGCGASLEPPTTPPPPPGSTCVDGTPKLARCMKYGPSAPGTRRRYSRTCEKQLTPAEMCEYYISRWCKVAKKYPEDQYPHRRRRRYAKDARDNCPKTCGICSDL